MKINKYLSIVTLLLISFSNNIFSQTDTTSLILNGSFEQFDGKLKKQGEFELTQDWTSPTDTKADLFSKTVKSQYVQAPKNVYGVQDPSSGKNYAGALMYSYNSKQPRSYVSTKLKREMIKGNLYCIKFYISLADLSKFAINNIGIYLTNGKPDVNSANSIVNDKFITAGTNAVIDEMAGWQQVCRLYEAKGGEKFITLGNFAKDENTQALKVKRPTGITEAQLPIAYYFIDDVEVNRVEYKTDCICMNGGVPESSIVYSSSGTIADDMTNDEKMANLSVYFYQYKEDLTSTAKMNLDKIAAIMLSNQDLKLEVIGNTDDDELKLSNKKAELKKLGLNRANNALEYIAAKGIDRSRLFSKDAGTSKPASTIISDISISKNRRVEFKITK
jgi:outer membrane protein OmpA-like peptidoglycan-associated protein